MKKEGRRGEGRKTWRRKEDVEVVELKVDWAIDRIDWSYRWAWNNGKRGFCIPTTLSVAKVCCAMSVLLREARSH